MKRFELYLDNNDRLVLSEFKTVDSEYESRIFKGAETYEIIRRLASSKLVDICEYKNRNDILLEYKNYIINLNDYDTLLRKRGMAPLLRNINSFKEKEILNKKINKKVKRKNKYRSRRIIASGLTIIIIGSCAANLFKKENKLYNNDSSSKTITEIDLDEIEPTNLSFEIEPNEVEQDIKIDLNIEEDQNKVIPVTINYEDRSLTDKIYTTNAYYGDLIDKYAKQYGLDPNLVLAIATQERGIHSSIKDEGGATGLMQIQNGVWENKYISAYNFNTKSIEKIYVTKEKIEDLSNNIKFGCMYLQNCMEYMDYNVVAAVQCYNMGRGNMMKILRAYSADTKKSIEDVLSDQYDTGWLFYRNIPGEGDAEYIENVFSWLGTDFELNNKKTDNSLIVSNISNNIGYKKIY